MGLESGLFYGLTAGIVGTVMLSLFGDRGRRMLLERMRELPEMVAFLPQIAQELAALGSATVSASTFLWETMSSTLAGVVFSTLGGLIGGAAYRSRARYTPKYPRIISWFC